MSRILIAPDAVRAEIGESFLDRRAFVVRTAADAAEALVVAVQWRPDLILFDGTLRGMTPGDFVEEVRRRSTLAATKLLVVGASAGALTACAHVTRPIDRGQLLDTIGGLLHVSIRRARRCTVDLSSEIEHKVGGDGKATLASAHVVRLSETGALLECEPPLGAGAVVRLQLSLPGHREPLRSVCIVLYVATDSGPYGVEFVDMGPHDRERIRRYVAHVHDRASE